MRQLLGRDRPETSEREPDGDPVHPLRGPMSRSETGQTSAYAPDASRGLCPGGRSIRAAPERTAERSPYPFAAAISACISAAIESGIM